MSNYLKLYLLTRLDGVNGLLVAVIIIGIIAIIGFILFNLISRDFDEFHHGKELEARLSTRKTITGQLKWIVPVTIFSILFFTALPTQRDVIFIVAGGKTIDFIENDSSVNKIPKQTTLIISEFLEKQIKELQTDSVK